jgi:hypothetical protein
MKWRWEQMGSRTEREHYLGEAGSHYRTRSNGREGRGNSAREAERNCKNKK